MDDPFGLAPIKREGGPIHPDDPHHGVWDGDLVRYEEMLRRYYDTYGSLATGATYCSHPEILEKIKNEDDKAHTP